MKKTFLALAAVALFATPASALSIFGLEITAPVQKERCHPISTNYMNAAPTACSDNGSGGVGIQTRIPDKCPYEK